MNFTDPADMQNLLYVSFLSNNSVSVDPEEFRELTSSEKISKEMIRKLDKESRIMSLFQKKSDESFEKSDVSFSDLVSSLIAGGTDISYLMNASLCDLPVLIEAVEKKKREKMESCRLWTYLTILPHVDGKKLKSPVDFFPFPWESEEQKEKAKKEMERIEAEFLEFMKTGKYK